MFAQKQKLRCSAACCFPRSLAAALAAQLVLTYCQTRLCDPILSFKKSNIVRQKHYFSIRIVFIYDKRPFSSHSWVWCPSFLGAILLFSVLQYLAIHPQNWHSLLKRELLEQRRKWVLARGVKFERSYTWWWCWWCLASATPTPDLRFPHIWKLHVTKFELQAAKTIWRKLEPTQVSILLLRSK